MRRIPLFSGVALLGLTLLTSCSRHDSILNPTLESDRASSSEARSSAAVGPLAHTTMIHALTENGFLVTFSATDPGTILSRVRISGLDEPSTKLLGIDFRPATGQLYGLASSSRLYTIDTSTGVATAVGPVFTTALSGSAFGFDFNPAVDRIRIVSNAGQNLRAHPVTGAVVAVDGALAYAAGDAHAGGQPEAVGAAYTNPDNDPATATALYDIDAVRDLLVTQTPPNSGTLNSVGGLGIDIEELLGFDITLAGGTNVGYLAVKATGSDVDAEEIVQAGQGRSGNDALDSANQLLRIDLGTGVSTALGRIGGGGPVIGLAVPVPQP